MINQREFCDQVAAECGLKWGTVKAYLNISGFQCAEHRVQGRYNRPYYNADQIESAVQLVRKIQGGNEDGDSQNKKEPGKQEAGKQEGGEQV